MEMRKNINLFVASVQMCQTGRRPLGGRLRTETGIYFVLRAAPVLLSVTSYHQSHSSLTVCFTHDVCNENVIVTTVDYG